MDLHVIRKRILTLSPYVKDIEITTQENELFANIYPDYKALKAAHIVNIESELRWYAIELYNMEVTEPYKIDNYKISTKKENLTSNVQPDDELYESLKTYIATLSSITITPSSHIELDLGLDSLDYVQLFTFIEQSFGVTMNEVIFSNIMQIQELYEYIKEHQHSFEPRATNWKTILDAPFDEKLTYSPYIMGLYKTLLLPLFKLYFRLEVSGKENLLSSPCIFAPSHQSMLDGFLLVASLPYAILKRSFFLAFEVLFGTSLLRPIAKHSQNLLIDANHNLIDSIQRSTLPLKAKKNLVIFPEGARSRNRKLLEFRPLFAILSKEYNTPVIPVVIDGGFEALESGKIFPRPKKIKITFLKPIYPNELSYDEIIRQTKEAIHNEMTSNPISCVTED